MRLELLPLLLLAPAAWLLFVTADRARARKLEIALGPRVPVGRRRFDQQPIGSELEPAAPGK